MILEKSRDLRLRQGLIEVSGLTIWGRRKAAVFLSGESLGRLEALVTLVNEWNDQGYAGQVRTSMCLTKQT